MATKYPMQIVFVDHKPAFIDAIRTAFAGKPYVRAVVGDVKDVPREGAIFISPSNSFLFLDGGVDLTYSREMFPDIEERVRERLPSIGLTSKYGRPYLPIGGAMISSVGLQTWFVNSPTMWQPQDVPHTRNAYHAFLAALMVILKSKVQFRTIVCPGLCLGWGKMDPVTAANQIRDAWEDFVEWRWPQEGKVVAPDVFLPAQEPVDEQPNHYANLEFKDIPV